MKTINITKDEDIISIVDKINREKDSKINLVIPQKAEVFQNLVNLMLLKREADSLGKEIVIVTSDNMGQRLAEKAGFLTEFKQEGDMEEIDAKRLEPSKMVDIVTPRRRTSFKENKGALSRKEKIEKKIPKKEKSVPEKSSFLSRKEEEELPFFREWDREENVSFKDKESLLKRFFLKKEGKSEEEKEDNVYTSFFPLKVLIFFVCFTLIVGGMIVYFLFPRAEIKLSPHKETVSLDLNLFGSVGIPKIDPIDNKFPIQLIKVEKEKSMEFFSTGEEEINRYATGIITVFNKYSSKPQGLWKGTRFKSSEGKIFRTTKYIVIPGAKIEQGKIVPSSISVEVIADKPGEEYNIGPSEFVIAAWCEKKDPRCKGFYGKSEESMKGGFSGKAKIVLKKDIENAKETILKELDELSKNMLNEQIPSGFELIEKSIKKEVSEISFSAEEKDVADKFTAKAKLLISGILYNKSDIKELIDINISSHSPEGTEVLPNTSKIEWKKVNVDWDKKEANFEAKISGKVIYKIDKKQFREEIAGKTIDEVKEYIAENSRIDYANVSIWPFWVKKIPYSLAKIKITIID